MTKLFNHTIKRNSAANPGFTAGFAVPLYEKEKLVELAFANQEKKFFS